MLVASFVQMPFPIQSCDFTYHLCLPFCCIYLTQTSPHLCLYYSFQIFVRSLKSNTKTKLLPVLSSCFSHRVYRLRSWQLRLSNSVPQAKTWESLFSFFFFLVFSYPSMYCVSKSYSVFIKLWPLMSKPSWPWFYLLSVALFSLLPDILCSAQQPE